jgi:hypothetical protein
MMMLECATKASSSGRVIKSSNKKKEKGGGKSQDRDVSIFFGGEGGGGNRAFQFGRQWHRTNKTTCFHQTFITDNKGAPLSRGEQVAEASCFHLLQP